MLRPRHRPPSPTAQSDLGASSSASLVDRPFSTPAATRRLVDALHRVSRRCSTPSVYCEWGLLRSESRCVLLLPAPPPWRSSLCPSRLRQLLKPLCRRDDELTRAPCAQNGLERWMYGRVERCRNWRSTSSASSPTLYVPPALSSRATCSSMHSCASVSCALTSFTLRAG